MVAALVYHVPWMHTRAEGALVYVRLDVRSLDVSLATANLPFLLGSLHRIPSTAAGAKPRARSVCDFELGARGKSRRGGD